MKILINNKVSQLKRQEESTLEELMVRIQETVHKNDESQIIVDVQINGERLSDSGKEMDGYNLNDISSLEIQTDNLVETLIRTLGAIKNDLPNLSVGMSNIATSLQEGNREEALRTFSQVCEEWRRVIQFLDNVSQLLLIDYSTLQFGDKTIDTANEELLLLLRDTKLAIENDDLVMLSDLVEYELVPKIEEEITIVGELISYIKKELQ